ncbi:hypothetical protein ACFVWL_18865 [Microbacterium sp. NPDC058269]|uniref:hypothetical protein n=1 Tax=Microbacterium sp. NPDC058269 TaxID=3346414 RepID=UPI0036DC9133
MISQKIKKRAAMMLAGAALAAGGIVTASVPASAGTIWGPYSTNAQCQADRTEYLSTGMRAMHCVRETTGPRMWYFYAY